MAVQTTPSFGGGFDPPLDRVEEALLVCLTSIHKAQLDFQEVITRYTRVVETLKICTRTAPVNDLNRNRIKVLEDNLPLLVGLRKILHEISMFYVEAFFKKRHSRVMMPPPTIVKPNA